jgi:hypothetical protein
VKYGGSIKKYYKPKQPERPKFKIFTASLCITFSNKIVLEENPALFISSNTSEIVSASSTIIATPISHDSTNRIIAMNNLIIIPQSGHFFFDEYTPKFPENDISEEDMQNGDDPVATPTNTPKPTPKIEISLDNKLTMLVSSSETSYYKYDTESLVLEKESQDIAGPFPLIALSEFNDADGSIVFFASDKILNFATLPANKDLIFDIIAWQLNSQPHPYIQTDDIISSNRPFIITQSQTQAIMIFLTLTPALLFFVAAMILIWRPKKNTKKPKNKKAKKTDEPKPT